MGVQVRRIKSHSGQETNYLLSHISLSRINYKDINIKEHIVNNF